jgi:hypothetical protein
MEELKELHRISISLDKESYKVLKQKSSYKGISMNTFLKKLATDVNITTHTIGVHDLSKTIEDLDMITCKAWSYYDQVVRKNESLTRIDKEKCDDMICLFYQLRDYLTGYCQKFVDDRSKKVNSEAEKIQKRIDESIRSSYRDQSIGYEDRKKYNMIVRMTPYEFERLKKNMETAALFGNNVSGYFRNLIMSKYYIELNFENKDIHTFVEVLYAATRYGKNIISLLYNQGETEKAQELESLYNEVQHNERELFDMVHNDRIMLYKHFYRKIHESEDETWKMFSLIKERGLWQSQEYFSN